MGRLSLRSNPTNLVEIDKSRVRIAVAGTAGQKSFSLKKLDVSGLGLEQDLQVICVARGGKTSQRIEMGALAEWSRDGFPLESIDGSEPLRFRVLLHRKNDPRIVASAEGLRAVDEAQSESLLPMEPAQLGERLWCLDINEDDGPVLLYNVSVFPSATGVESYLPFSALVIPQALSMVLHALASDPAGMEDESGWKFLWRRWLDSLGVDEMPKDAEESEIRDWCKQATARFCEKYRFASSMAQALTEGAGS